MGRSPRSLVTGVPSSEYVNVRGAGARIAKGGRRGPAVRPVVRVAAMSDTRPHQWFCCGVSNACRCEKVKSAGCAIAGSILFVVRILITASGGVREASATSDVQTNSGVLEFAGRVRRAAGSKSPIVFVPGRSQDIQRRRPGIAKAMRELRWQPRTTLAVGLRQTVDWYRGCLPAPRAARMAVVGKRGSRRPVRAE